jgi:fatty-acyl-CoA synthase
VTTSPATHGLFGWLAAPSGQRGIRFADDDGDWPFTSYAEIAAMSARVADRLSATGAPPGTAVVLVAPSTPGFAAGFFGSWLAGYTPCPVVPPTLFASTDAYLTHVAALLRVTEGEVLCDPALLEIMGQAMSQADLAGRPISLDDLPAAAQASPQAPPDVALLQFTSGSSGQPRGVRVSGANLEFGVESILDWSGWGADEPGVHWLPLHHDFGLIGGFLAPAAGQRDVWVLRPEQFVLSPQRWLDCLGRRGAGITASPTFGFSYALSKVAPEALTGCDFSTWRVAATSAERPDPGVLNRFGELLAPHGFSVESYTPAYGLAEATLGVTCVPVDEIARVVKLDWSSLQVGEPVHIEEEAQLGSERIGDGAGWLVSCGSPRADVRVAIVDATGAPQPPGTLGEVRVTGSTVALGYTGHTEGSLTRFSDDGLLTADAGFVHAGELYVVGRMGDSIKVRGRAVYAEDLEAKLATVEGVGRGRCCVVPALDSSGTGIVAIVENGGAPFAWDRAIALLESEASDTPIRIVIVAPGSIPRTSSGKPRRRMLAEQLLSGSLEVSAQRMSGS